jgi:ADP-ribose pyrophosphatase
MSNDRPWRIANSTYVIDTPFLRLRKDTVILPDGRQVDDYFVRETRGFVIIFAVTPGGDVIFTREYRHGFGTYLLGLPGGQIDAGEQPVDCARRELAEETGYTGAAPQFIQSFVTAPVNSDGSFWVYLIRDAQPTTLQSFDPTEDIAIELHPLDRVLAMVRDGTTRISEHCLAIYATLDHLGKL